MLQSQNSRGIEFPNTIKAINFDFLPAPTTFPKFKKLAPELRHMIWKLSLPGPRVVDIIYDKNQDKYFSFHSQVPSLLHTVGIISCYFPLVEFFTAKCYYNKYLLIV